MAPFSAMLKSKSRRPTRPPTPPSPASFYSPVTSEPQQRSRSTTLPSSFPAEGGNTALPAGRVFPAHPYARQGRGGLDSPAPSESNAGDDDVLENISSFAFPLPPSNEVRKIRFADQLQKEQQSRKPGQPKRTSSEFKVSLHLNGQATLQDILLDFGLTEPPPPSENVPEKGSRGSEQSRNRNRSATVPLLNVEDAPTPSTRKAAPSPIQIPIGKGTPLEPTATSEGPAPTGPTPTAPGSGSAYLTPLVSSSTAIASAGHSSTSPQSDTVTDPGSAAWRRMALSPATTVADRSAVASIETKSPGKRLHSRNSKPQPPIPLSPPYRTPTGPDSSFQAFQARTRPPRPPHPPNSKGVASGDPTIANMVSSALARQSTGSAITTFTTATVAPNIGGARSPTTSVLSIGAAPDMPFTPNFLMPSHRMSDDANGKVRVDSATLPVDFARLQREEAPVRSPLSGGLSPLSRPSITPSTATPPPSAFERAAEVSKTKSARRSVSANDVRALVLQAGQLVDSNVKRLADRTNEDGAPPYGATSASFVLGRPPSIRRPSLTGSVQSGPIVPSQHAKSASVSVPPASGSPGTPVSASSSDGSAARGANGRQTPLSRSPLVPDLGDIHRLRKGSEDSLNSVRSERIHQLETASEDLQRRALNGASGLVIIQNGEEQRLVPQKALRKRRSFTKAPRPAPAPAPGQPAEDVGEPSNSRRASLLHTRRPNPLALIPRSNSIVTEPLSPRRERSASESVPLSPRHHIHRSSSISDLPTSPPLAPGSQAPSSFSAALGRAIYGGLMRKRSDPSLSSSRTPNGTLGESKQPSKPVNLNFAPSKISNGQLNSPSQFPQTPRPYSISTSSADHHHQTLTVPPALVVQPPDGTRISITPSPPSPSPDSPSVAASKGAARVAATLPIGGTAPRKNQLTVTTPGSRAGTSKGASPISPKPRSTNTPSPVETAFETNPIQWKGLTMDAAKWTLSSQQLQDIVSRAIRSSAEASAIRLLPPDLLDTQIPNETTRLEDYREDVKAQYKYQSRRRSLLLRSLALYMDGSDPDTSRRLTDDLIECGETCDRLCMELFQITDQLAQLSQLTQRHNSSALSMALRKLNTSFIKAKGETIDLQLQVAMIEAERDEAWAVAENIERDLDQIKHKADGDMLHSPNPHPPSSWGSKSPRSTSRVSAAKKSSGRASKSSLRISSSSRSSGSSVRFAPIIPPNSPGFVAADEPPPVPVIRPELHSRRTSSMVELTPSSSSKAMAQAQAQLFHMLGISQEDLFASPRRRSYSQPSSPTSGARRARTLSLPGSMGLLESPKVITAVLNMRSKSD